MSNKTQNDLKPRSHFSYVQYAKYVEFFKPPPPPDCAQERPQSMPEKPAKPKSGSHLDLWFDWYHAMQTAGYKYTLREIAKEIGHNAGYIGQLHANYMKSRELVKPKRPNKN